MYAAPTRASSALLTLLDLALSILEKLIQTRWKILPREQALGTISPVECKSLTWILGIRHFIVSLIVKNSSDERTMHNEKVYINKLNLVLVEVANLFTPSNTANSD